MTGLVEDIGPSALVVAAGLTVDQHRGEPRVEYHPGRCRQCTEDGCEQLAWAQETLASYRAQRGSLYGTPR